MNHCCRNLPAAFFITHYSFFLGQACFVSRGWLESLISVSSIGVQRTYQVRIRVVYSTSIRQYPCVSESLKIWGTLAHAHAVDTRPSLSPAPPPRRPGDEARSRPAYWYPENQRRYVRVKRSRKFVFRYRLREWFSAVLLEISELSDIDLVLYPKCEFCPLEF